MALKIFFFQFHPSFHLPPHSTYCIPAGPCCTHSVFETEHSFFSPFVIESSHHCASRSLALILDIFSLKGHGWSSNLRKWYWSWSSLLSLAAEISKIWSLQRKLLNDKINSNLKLKLKFLQKLLVTFLHKETQFSDSIWWQLFNTSNQAL